MTTHEAYDRQMIRAADEAQIERIAVHVRQRFGYHGGVGDPPDADAIRAVIVGAFEWLEEHHSVAFLGTDPSDGIKRDSP